LCVLSNPLSRLILINFKTLSRNLQNCGWAIEDTWDVFTVADKKKETYLKLEKPQTLLYAICNWLLAFSISIAN
jgi:hypothetical protein